MTKTNALLDFIMRVRPCEIGWIIKTIARIDREEVEIDGFTFWIDPASNFGYRLLKHGHYEPEMTAAVLNLLNEDDTFVDLGANEGWFSLWAAKKVGLKGQVLCVEPQERLWPVILRNVSLNRNLCASFILVPEAIGPEGDWVNLTITPSLNTGASSLIPSQRFLNRQKVICRSLDSVCDLYCKNPIGLMKMDIEGYELVALRSGSKSLLAKKIRNILIEIHPKQLTKLKQHPSQVYSLLESFGYRHELLDTVHLFTCD